MKGAKLCGRCLRRAFSAREPGQDSKIRLVEIPTTDLEEGAEAWVDAIGGYGAVERYDPEAWTRPPRSVYVEHRCA